MIVRAHRPLVQGAIHLVCCAVLIGGGSAAEAKVGQPALPRVTSRKVAPKPKQGSDAALSPVWSRGEAKAIRSGKGVGSKADLKKPGSSRARNADSKLIALMKDFRADRLGAREKTASSDHFTPEQVISTFLERNIRGDVKLVQTNKPTEYCNGSGTELSYSYKGYTVAFDIKNKDRAAMEKINPEAMKAVVASIGEKLERSDRYYRKLLAGLGHSASDYEKGIPHSVNFDHFSGKDYQANADYGTITLGHKMLLNKYATVLYHENYHLIAEGLLGKHRGNYRKSTPLNEGLADYFAAVVGNQSQMLDPAVRQVKNGFTSSDWAKLGDKGYHDQGQVISGFLWQLRKNVNRQSRTPWGDISPVDRLAVVAHRDYTEETFGESEAVTLKTWIGAMLKADKKMNKGKYAALIRSVGEQRLGAKLADPKASKPPRSSAHRPGKGR